MFYFLLSFHCTYRKCHLYVVDFSYYLVVQEFFICSLDNVFVTAFGSFSASNYFVFGSGVFNFLGTFYSFKFPPFTPPGFFLVFKLRSGCAQAVLFLCLPICLPLLFSFPWHCFGVWFLLWHLVFALTFGAKLCQPP